MKVLNCCVVCYKNVQSLPPSSVNENGDCVTTRFIKLFQRHIDNFSLESSQIKNCRSALIFISKNGNDHEPIKLQACSSCSAMLSSFNSSYGDLKCAEMKANWSLQQIANVIRFVDYVPAKRTKFKESVNELEEDNLITDDAIKIISRFRKQLQHQCRAQYRNQLPRIMLLESKEGKVPQNSIPNRQITLQASAKSKNNLIATVLINLSSLQLILYLALFNSVLKKKADVSSDKRQTSLSRNTQCTSHSTDQNKLVNSSSAPPTPVCSADDDEHGDDDENDFGDDAERSTLDYHEEDNETNSNSNSVIANDKSCLDGGISAGRNDIEANTFTEYRIQIITDLTTHHCLNCQLEFDSEKGFEQHTVTCSKTTQPTSVTTNTESNSNVQIKQEPIEIPIPSKSQNTSQLKEGSNTYPCKKCGKVFKKPRYLRKHEARHLGIIYEKKHLCSTCGHKFPSKYSMEKHMKTHTKVKPSKPFPCPTEDCKMSFSNAAMLRRHQRKFHKTEPIEKTPHQKKLELNRSTYKLRCKQCSHRCKNKYYMRLHELTHLGADGKTHTCSDCGQKFSTISGMRSHILRVHTREKTFHCPADDCDVAFAHSHGLRLHKKKCDKITRLSCRHCRLQFDSHKEFQQHLETCSKTNCPSGNVQVKQKPIQNSIPNKSVNTSQVRKETKVYRCDQCGQQCKGSVRLRYHKLKHLGPDAWKYACSYCGKKFMVKDNMNVHIRLHTGEKPFKCSVEGCEMAFAQLISLRTHETTHLGPEGMKFSCNYCGRKFALKANMKIHLRTHTGEKPYKCPVDGCEKAFSMSGSLQIHQKIYHKDSKIAVKTPYQRVSSVNRSSNLYLCTQCGHVCKNSMHLRRHKLVHLGPEAWEHSCSYCGKKFIEKWNMTKHLRLHTGERPFKCSVDDCNKAFSQSKSLRVHQERCHKNDTGETNQNWDTRKRVNESSNMYLCKHCGKVCGDVFKLRRHEITHLGPESWKYSCSYCGKKFAWKANMKVHLTVHTGEKPFKCQVDGCKKAFPRAASLRRHQLNCGKNHEKWITNLEKSEKFRCNQCGQQCTSAVTLWYHKQTHLGPEGWKHSCSYCGKKFITKWSMNQHLTTHTGEKPFKCTVAGCEKSYSHLQNLQGHRKTHLGPEAWEYSCSYCGKRFARKANMKVHLRVHTGEKPFKCPVDGCENTFAHAANMRLHQKNCRKNDTDDDDTSNDEETNSRVKTRYQGKMNLKDKA